MHESLSGGSQAKRPTIGQAKLHKVSDSLSQTSPTSFRCSPNNKEQHAYLDYPTHPIRVHTKTCNISYGRPHVCVSNKLRLRSRISRRVSIILAGRTLPHAVLYDGKRQGSCMRYYMLAQYCLCAQALKSGILCLSSGQLLSTHRCAHTTPTAGDIRLSL